ncbi:MAG: magnesium/cobalt transporter CorA [Planctomycetes bacterium]|nr:magnesium/cobalt transporter CorA [Planctomycetota bacterium]
MLEVLDRQPISRPFQRQTSPGAAPGTIVAHPDARPPVITVARYNADELTEQQLGGADDLLTPLDRLPALLDDRHVTWINVDGLGDANVIRRLGDLLRMHPLAVEDVVHVHQRAKVEDYGDYLFIVTRMASARERLETEQLSIVLSRNHVVTFQEGVPGDCLDPVRERLRQNYGRIRQTGADYLAYAILDAVIDNYFPIVEDYGDRLENLDDAVAGSRKLDVMTRVHQLRSELLLLRRLIWPHREAVNELMRESHKLMGHDTRVYLRDTYDHIMQLIDVVETYREVCSDLRDFLLSNITNHTAEVTKVLTIIATIFIPLSFIAGVYGMNFQHMPGLGWRWGFALALAFMGLAAAALIGYIHRRGWFDS